jgi:hypothetical protein
MKPLAGVNMKRSEINEIYVNILKFESQFTCISVKVDHALDCYGSECICESADPYFSNDGCECCDGLAGEVYPCHGFTHEDADSRLFDNPIDFDICGDCLSVLINGDSSCLDYHVDDENEQDIRNFLKGVEIFQSEYWITDGYHAENRYFDSEIHLQEPEENRGSVNESGYAWFYWFCQPGCLPDSEPFGPFKSYSEAIDDLMNNHFNYAE